MVQTNLPWIVALVILSLQAIPSFSDDIAIAKSLLKFKQSLTNSTMLHDWKEPLVPNLCSRNKPVWRGCLCLNGSFIGLRLERMGLTGTIDVDSLSELPMYSLSVMHNNFSGPFPRNIKKLDKLRSLYLAHNSFSGEIPGDAFSGMKDLMRVVMGHNSFTGKIPVSLLGLPKLGALKVQNNQFEGRIPDFWQDDLSVNLSNNKLKGHIPVTLGDMDPSSFSGNINLCGKPLAPCKPKKSFIRKIACNAATAIIAALSAFIIILILYRMRVKPLQYKKSIDKYQIDEPNYAKTGNSCKNSEHGKLNFLKTDRERFELEDLLRASAEVLGSGTFGSSYKAVVFINQAYVVRRFRQMSSVGKEEFYEHMRRLGRLSHPNLLPLVAYYYKKEEKLLITDFVENGSLASHLHGKRSPNQPCLDWPKRLRIIKGVARGLAYICKEIPTLNLPHGHLKSSNVLLTNIYEPILSEYALMPVINKDHAQQFMVAYKSPESKQNKRVMRKTDVWSLGILILELLTGRYPTNYLKQGSGDAEDLATWVNFVVREEGRSEVFDKDMDLTRNCEDEIVKMLEIGMCCCETNVDKRLDFKEAVERIEEVKESS